MAESMAFPSNGDELLRFKRVADDVGAAHEYDKHAFAAVNTMILGDPSERLAELTDFEELKSSPPDAHEIEAIQQILGASRVRAQASHLQTSEAELQPFLDAVDLVLAHGDHEPDLPVAIMPHLLIGNKFSAWDVDTLRKHRVTHVLNCADAAAKGPLAHAALGIEYTQCDAQDDLGYDIMQHYATVAAVVRRCRDAGGVCLCHCHAGINRSGALVAAELMLSERMPLLEVVERCKRLRGQILWNTTFRLGLVRLAKKEGLLGQLPTGA